MTLGERICYRRNELHMTMEDLGNAIGVQRAAINKYEKDQIDLNVSKLKALSKALDVPIMYLLAEDNSFEEQQLVAAYRLAIPEIKEAAMTMLVNSAKSKKDTDQSAI